MEAGSENSASKASSLRWKILRRALLPRASTRKPADDETESEIRSVSRKTNKGFNMIPFDLMHEDLQAKEVRLSYTLPVPGSPKLSLTQRVDNCAALEDFEISNKFNIDNTGLVCQWPSEDVLAYFCMSHAELFRSKRVIELGSGYGLAGLVIAATTEALEVTISDGNPQVVDYSNSEVFDGTKVKSMALHWNQDRHSSLSNAFDVIVASDCTFFKEFHKGLARTVKCLLKSERSSEAIFFGPKRGDSLDKFLDEIKESGLHFSITENYNAEIWKRHQAFMNGDCTWPGYGKDHCYPLLLRITQSTEL